MVGFTDPLDVLEMTVCQSLLSLYSVSSVFLLDSDGRRLLAKYYHHSRYTAQDPKATLIANAPPPAQPVKTLKEQRAFEQACWDKTKKSQSDVILYQNQLILYKPSIDLTFYVCGDESQNELMLQGVLTAFYDAVSLLLRHQVEKRSILENLDLVVLALDETIDEGIILETDSTAIAARVSRPRPDVGSVDLSQITINEQTIMHAFSTVRDRMAARLLQV